MNDTLRQIRQPGRARDAAFVLAGAWLAALAGLGFYDPVFMFAFVPASIVVAIFALRPLVPIYLMAATYPFIGWEVAVGSLNAPVVDIVAVAALAGAGCRILWFLIIDPEQLKDLRFPGVWLFLLWLLAGALSLMNTWDLALSAKYLLRPLAFFFLAYIFFVVNALRDSVALWRVLFIMFGVGIAVGLYGVYGFMIVDAPSLFDRRIVPAALFGLNPLGGNQNIIADVMVTTIPIGFFLMLHMRSQTQQKFIFFGLLFMIAINLLTFSRSGWLALLVELGILIAFQYRHFVKTIVRYTTIVLIIAAPLIGYMYFFTTSEQVQSSNVNRMVLNDIALEMFREYPLFGQGAGTFVGTVERNRIYIEEFGAPLDAHGFIQKIGSELGAFGLATYLGMLAYVIWFIFREYRRHDRTDDWSYLLISLLMMAVGTIFFQLFQTSYFVAKLWFPLGVAMAAVYISRRQSRFVHDKMKVPLA
jgi:O-antigen ligase